jgi:SAM-dependent methyltransferase
MPTSGWIEFWDSKHPIYVNARHEAAHFHRITDGILRYAPPGGVMLDYGCGEALEADRVAEPLSRLILCEAAPNVRVMLGARSAGNNKILVRKPEDVAMMTPHSIDAIVMHSVAQYLPSPEFEKLAKVFHRLLRTGGLLVVGDVIPPKVSALADAKTLLQFGREEGFYYAALAGLFRTFFSEYRRLRRSVGITRYDSAAMTGLLDQAGFAVERAPSNIGHNDLRMTFLGRAR